MNSYSQKAKCQNQTDGSHVHKSQKSSARMMRVSKRTNTPPEFFICQQCQQIIGKKLNPIPTQLTVGDCGVGINEYTKALNYINSCHTIINKMITRIQEKDSQTSQILSMPDLPNFIDLFSSIHNIKQNQNLTAQEVNSPNCNNPPESPKSDDEMCESVADSDDKAERQSLEEQKTTYQHEEYIFPDPKQNDEEKAECDNNYSAPTTENEDSEVELEIPQQQPLVANKFKPVTSQNKREKVIYEEINSHDEDSRCNIQPKQTNTEEACPKQNHNPEFSTTRAKKNSNIPERIKNPVPNTPRCQEVNYLTVSTNTTQRKPKPRSASAKPNNYVAPGEKKDCGELNPNYSDTALSIKNTARSNNKVREKSLVQPISLGPNSALSQRELDKYAKELLGSESLSPRSNSPDSRNFSPKQPTRPKTEERSKSHVSKTTGSSSKSKQVEVKKRPKSHQERQAHPSRYQPAVQIQNVVMQQNGSKRHKNCLPPVSLHKSMADGQQPTDEQLLRNTQKQHNLSSTRSQNPTTYLHSSTVTNLHSSTKTNLNVSPTILCPTQSMKVSHEDDSHSTQQKYRRVKMRGPLTHTESNCETKSPSKIQETQQSMGQNHHMIMSRRMCPSGPINNNPEVKTQFSVTVKPNDFFTINRKTSSHHQRKPPKTNHVYNNAEEMNVESDDIKTDSDLDDDHFNNEEADKKSNPSLHIKKVLSNLGLFPNGQVNPEMEQLKMEAKSTRANDERNRPFREPRKTVPDPESPEMVRISADAQQELYQASSVTNLGRTQSDESSDIKSDNEDDYLRIKTVSYNCYSGNRYQT